MGLTIWKFFKVATPITLTIFITISSKILENPKEVNRCDYKYVLQSSEYQTLVLVIGAFTIESLKTQNLFLQCPKNTFESALEFFFSLLVGSNNLLDVFY